MPELTPGTPEWWLDRLDGRLNNEKRQKRLQRLADYYEGNHPLLFATDEFLEVFADVLKPLAVNFVSLVVDAPVERLTIQGFRSESEEIDAEANRIWRENDMDAWAVAAHREALAKSECALLVWTRPDGRPLISVEDPRQVIIDFNPGRITDRRAALKRWAEGDKAYATLYLPDGIYKYEQPLDASAKHALEQGQRSSVIARSSGGWAKRKVEEEAWPLPNPAGVVPVIPMVNRPDLLGRGRSEMEAVLPIQDALNKLACDMIIASEFAAFPQRYMIGVDTIDEETGNDKFDFRGAINRMLAVSNPDASMGEFSAADLENYVKAMEAFVQQMASISHTPPHYLLGRSGVIPNAESTTSAESGLVSKVRSHQSEKGPVWSEVIRVARLVAGEDAPSPVVPLWTDPERRSWSEFTDALSKEAALGVPPEILWAKMGYAPEEIARIKSINLEHELELTAEKVDMLKSLVQTGFTPDAAAAAIGLAPIEHTERVPWTLRNEGEELGDASGNRPGA